MATSYLDHPGPIAFAHRGFSHDGLENTMAAFQAAIDLGYTYLETDVHATSDGVLVAFHDHTLDRMTNATGAIERLPWSTVARARLARGETVPRLDDVLTAWPDVRVNIDVKSPSAVASTIRCIDDHGAHERVLVGSFDDRSRRAVVTGVGARVATSAGTTTVRAFLASTVVPGTAATRRAVRDVDCLQVPERAGSIRVVSPRTIAAAHAAGIQVHVWTVNDPDDMRRLLDWGVDGIVTDRADLLREVLQARGDWPARDD